MNLTNDDVRKIAHLARLKVADDKLGSYVEELGQIFNFVEQINSINTDDIEPMSHPFKGTTQRLREDVVSEDNQRDQLQECAQQTQSGFYLVPKVIDSE